MKLNVECWKEFRLNKLYEIKNGNKFDKNKLDLYNPEVNLVSRVSFNNGVDVKVGLIDSIDPFEKGLLTVALGGSYLGSCFVQEEPFYTAQNVAVMKSIHQEMTHSVNLFISALVRFESKKKFHAFGRELNTHLNKDFTIRLPVLRGKDKVPIMDSEKKYSDEGFIPDWDFMEGYIEVLGSSRPMTINPQNNEKPLNVAEWQKFKIAKIFDSIENGKVCQAGKLEIGDEIWYLGAKRDDNGLMFKTKYEASLVSKGNCIVFICDGQGSIGYANYMDKDFLGTANLALGYKSNLNKYNGLFLSTIISLERPKLTYGRKWKPLLKNTEIKLPVVHNPDGTFFIDENKTYSNEGFVPDFEFMERYIKALPYGDCI